jgi:hypothetical protein
VSKQLPITLDAGDAEMLVALTDCVSEAIAVAQEGSPNALDVVQGTLLCANQLLWRLRWSLDLTRNNEGKLPVGEDGGR